MMPHAWDTYPVTLWTTFVLPQRVKHYKYGLVFLHSLSSSLLIPVIARLHTMSRIFVFK